MASPNMADTLVASTGPQTERVPEEPGNTGSPSTEAEILVKALRNMINPPTRPTDGESKHDMNQSTMGPDGEQFVIALKKFMASFLHQRGPEGGIKVELEEKEVNVLNTEAQATSDDDRSAKDVAEPPPDGSMPEENTSNEGLWSILPLHNEELPDGIMNFFGSPTSISHTDRLELRKSRFIKKVLDELRKHVFNHMPIRLLCFKSDASNLQITLVERGEIYTHVASNLVGEITGHGIDGHWGRMELIQKYSRYAILSHTWLRGESREITYDDWLRGEFDTQQPGYQKLANFCRTSWIDHGIAFGWMDTICINKESSSELDESIRSMYKWYKGASVCITYLADTKMLLDMHNDSWFTRGWTLQELFAPSHIKFYNAHWNKLVESDGDDKKTSVIVKQIQEATTITADELSEYTLLYIPISRRMQMAAKRQVTREEDSAYSLMGIFNVSMATAYGEGAGRAFYRLLQEVLNLSTYGVTEIFNWAGYNESPISCLLPYSLQDYLRRSSNVSFAPEPIEPIMLTHLGLRITILLMPAISITSPTESHAPFGDYHAITDIIINDQYNGSNYQIGGVVSYSVLDARISDSAQGLNQEQNWFQVTLGVLNIGDGGNGEIKFSKSCLAVALRFGLGSPRKISTEVPITFTIDKRGGLPEDVGYYSIKRRELGDHGMKLVSIVL